MAESSQRIEPEHQQSFIEPDTFDDNDSSYQSSLGDASYTTSITSSAMNYTYVFSPEQFCGF
ncbi:uncharacterized protein BDV17DRAFT_256719 [Aspergillus undulatus]|uniref:uncharacterized protein n=1 Tax=Aspergillus undulatus TaxID=1810928 RepID=UPI003CCD22CE